MAAATAAIKLIQTALHNGAISSPSEISTSDEIDRS
jgi:hypothetical protein